MAHTKYTTAAINVTWRKGIESSFGPSKAHFSEGVAYPLSLFSSAGIPNQPEYNYIMVALDPIEIQPKDSTWKQFESVSYFNKNGFEIVVKDIQPIKRYDGHIYLKIA